MKVLFIFFFLLSVQLILTTAKPLQFAKMFPGFSAVYRAKHTK